MLQIEKNYDFRKRMLTLHEKNIRNSNAILNNDEIEITDGISIILGSDSEVIFTAAQDFVEYLHISMNVSAIIVKKGTNVNGKYISVDLAENNGIDLGSANGYKGFRIDTDENIHITAFDDRGGAQGLYHLEEMMTLRKAPFIKKETVFRKPMFSPQMVHSGYGLDEYPNEHLQAIAHEGRDAILIFVKDVNITPYGYMDFNELIHRAKKYGIDVYAYSYLQSDFHPDAKGAEEYYDASYGKLFEKCPLLKGIILVGESVGFPSHDPNVAPSHKTVLDKDGLPVGKPRSGWWPCVDFPEWVELIKKVVRKHSDTAEIVFWTYNWGRQPEKERVRLIESLPTDITLLAATIEKCEKVFFEDVEVVLADYSLQSAGPSPVFTSEAIAAAKRGIRLYTMTNTGGLTWDFGLIPYEPMPFQWMKRYQVMKDANRDWGLCGIMESHHYGIYPSFISKLSKWCFNDPTRPMEEILDDALTYEYGEDCLTDVKEALKAWSEAINYYTPTDNDQYCAFRLGPAYPFCFLVPYKNPSAPYAHFGNGIYNAAYATWYPHEVTFHKGAPVPIRLAAEIRSLGKMLDLMEQGVKILECIENKNDKLLYLLNLGKYILNSVKTAISAKKWYKLVSAFHSSESADEVLAVLDNMEKLLSLEIENAKDTIPLVEYDSRLGWEPSMEYIGDREHIEWKIKHANYVINTEIAAQKNAAKIGRPTKR